MVALSESGPPKRPEASLAESKYSIDRLTSVSSSRTCPGTNSTNGDPADHDGRARRSRCGDLSDHDRPIGGYSQSVFRRAERPLYGSIEDGGLTEVCLTTGTRDIRKAAALDDLSVKIACHGGQ